MIRFLLLASLRRLAKAILCGELINRGEAFADGNQIWMVTGTAALVVSHVTILNLVMKHLGLPHIMV